MAELAIDEDYQRRVRERDIVLAARAEERNRKLLPFTSELAAAGIEPSKDSATIQGDDGRTLLSIALDHLARDGYDDETRATIARYLEVKAAAKHWHRIAAFYLNAAGESERDALAAALATSARAEQVDQLIDFVGTRSLGTSRVFFLRPINRLRRGTGRDFVSQLVDDPQLGKEATAIMRSRSRNS